ncbi:MAG TPA: hypothetical protein VHW90_04165 [Stellaceae bacterium]|jgi:hypothetical protein|nr:hypothetical protein [Stellaceae bacterium]
MSELDDAVAILERAVARLEAASDPTKRAAEDERLAAVTAAIGQRLDIALAKIGHLLEREN